MHINIISAIMYSVLFTEIKQCDPLVVGLDVQWQRPAWGEVLERWRRRHIKTLLSLAVCTQWRDIAPSPLQARLAAPLTSHFPSGSLAFAWDICHLSQPEPRGLPEKVKDFTKICKFASVVTIIEIAFVRLHIIIKSLVSLLATFPLPVGLLQQ